MVSSVPMSQERRADPRVPIRLRVAYERVNAFIADYARNISRGGTFVRTDAPLAVGTEIIFVLSVPGRSEEVTLVGVVARVVDPGAARRDNPAGMGIRFVYRSEADKRTVRSFFSSVLAQELGPEHARKLLSSIPPPMDE